MKKIKSVTDIIAAFGGNSGAAVALGTSMSAVSGWKMRGVPHARHKHLERELRRMGYSVAESAFWPVARKASDVEVKKHKKRCEQKKKMAEAAKLRRSDYVQRAQVTADREAMASAKKRRCLRCGCSFKSFGNRLCETCHKYAQSVG